MDHLLEAVDLVKSYRGKRAVDGVSLQVRDGEVVGLLGPNGAGKTTTFNMLIGTIRADAGRVILDGRDITSMPMHARAAMGLGYLPQESSVFRGLTVAENVEAVLEARGVPKAERARRVAELLDELGVSALAARVARTLSGGERRRVEIARALATDPCFLLLDEPFTGIDPIALAEVREIVGGLRERGYGILITDHNVRETLGITDRAYLVFEGRVLMSGTPKELASDERAKRFYLGDDFSL